MRDCKLISAFESSMSAATITLNRQRAKIEALQMDNAQLQSDVINANMNLEHMTAEIEEHKNKCDKCGAKTRACIESLQNNIAEKQAEIEELETEYEKVYEQAEADILGNLPQGGASCHWCIDKHKKYAIKEFAERLKGKFNDDADVLCEQSLVHYHIDNLVKEMVGVDNDQH